MRIDKEPSQKKPKVFVDRDYSWIQFNERVQQEAENPANPLLERVKFLSIVSSNLEEFVEVRYHWLIDEDNEKTRKWLRKINPAMEKQMLLQYSLYDRLSGELYRQGIRLYPAFSLTQPMRSELFNRFRTEILPRLRPQPLSEAAICRDSTYLCVKLHAPHAASSAFRVLAVPKELPCWYSLNSDSNSLLMIRIEEIIRLFAEHCFPKDSVEFAGLFRVLCNQDFPVETGDADVLEQAVRAMVQKRRFGEPLRLLADAAMSEEMLDLLLQRLNIGRERVWRLYGPPNLAKSMMALYHGVHRASLKYEPLPQNAPPELMGDDPFTQIARRDWLLYHPYHSYEVIQHVLACAAQDPSVTAIFQTLYRVSPNSRIVHSLLRASQNGKRVFAFLETRARFDEENNLYWAHRLQEAGCEVRLGIPDTKVHAKTCLIERSIHGQKQCILHLGTGNYHDETTSVYADFSLLTADPVLTADAQAFFSALRGEKAQMRELIQSSDTMKPKLLALIEREIQNAMANRPAAIFVKMNALNDKTMMKKLVQASQCGVQVRMLVRGLCGLLPGIPGQTEQIRIRSLVGRNLEHARAFVFANGGSPEVYLSSADWMHRNLDKRIELMFPIKDVRCRKAVLEILRLQWCDTEKCRKCRSDGSYVCRPKGIGGIDAQEILYRHIDAVADGSLPFLQDLTDRNTLFTGQQAYPPVNPS